MITMNLQFLWGCCGKEKNNFEILNGFKSCIQKTIVLYIKLKLKNVYIKNCWSCQVHFKLLTSCFTSFLKNSLIIGNFYSFFL